MDFDPQTAFVGFTCVPTLQSSKSVFHIGISDPIRHSNLKFRLPIVNFWGICFLLVGETTGGGFETLGGDKTHCFISRNKKLTILKSLQYTPSLSL